MSEDQVLQALGALAHPLRLKVFRALVVVGTAGMTAGTIMEGVGVPAATLSFHLKELTDAGLVTQERSGRHFVYRAAYERMNAVLAFLTDNCCAGAACALEPAAASAAKCGC